MSISSRPHRRTCSILTLTSLALAAPAGLVAQAVDLDALQGNWIRAGSNYNPNDQMRITIAGGQATLTRVPTTVHTAFRVGQALWMGIAPDGTLRVRGSDGAYYPGQVRLVGADSLVLAVGHTGAGNDQAWRRGGPTVDGEWVRIAPGDPTADGMRVLADQDKGTIRFLPAEAPRSLRIGTRIWSEIGAGGAVQLLDAGGRYLAATIKLEGTDRLRVEVPGRDEPQLWVRPAAVAAARAEAMARSRPPG
jgi:hypothetical protein